MEGVLFEEAGEAVGLSAPRAWSSSACAFARLRLAAITRSLAPPAPPLGPAPPCGAQMTNISGVSTVGFVGVY